MITPPTAAPTAAEERARQAAAKQLDAYNRRDIDAFAACFHPEVQLFDLKTGAPRGEPGRAALHATYGAVFARCTALHAEVTSRVTVGNVAFDREVVTGLRDDIVHAMAIYEVDEAGLITRVWFVIDAPAEPPS